MNFLAPRFKELHLHAALTIEGREDADLPEQSLVALRIRGLDLAALAKEVEL